MYSFYDYCKQELQHPKKMKITHKRVHLSWQKSEKTSKKKRKQPYYYDYDHSKKKNENYS